jgi:hypothetical protein
MLIQQTAVVNREMFEWKRDDAGFRDAVFCELYRRLGDELRAKFCDGSFDREPGSGDYIARARLIVMTEKEWDEQQQRQRDAILMHTTVAYSDGVKAGKLNALAKIKDGLAKMVGL